VGSKNSQKASLANGTIANHNNFDIFHFFLQREVCLENVVSMEEILVKKEK
jgi:hypothetical protein